METAAVKPKNIFQRMIEVQKKVSSVMKNETVKMSEKDKGYKAVTHDDVAACLHLPLAEAGIFMLPEVIEYSPSEFEVTKKNNYGEYKQRWFRTDLKISVKWINVDDPSDFIEVTGYSFALDTSDKSFAKAYSLALKIVLLKVHLLESRDGEEKRTFEEETTPPPQQGKAKNQNQRPAKNNQQTPPPKTESQKPAAAPELSYDDMMKKIDSLMEEKKVNGADLDNLVSHGYGVRAGEPLPNWAAKDIIKLLSLENVDTDIIEARADELFQRRQKKNDGRQRPAGV